MLGAGFSTNNSICAQIPASLQRLVSHRRFEKCDSGFSNIYYIDVHVGVESGASFFDKDARRSLPVASQLVLIKSWMNPCYTALMKKTKQGPEKQMRARENQRNSVRATKREPERTKEGQKDPERESQRINQ